MKDPAQIGPLPYPRMPYPNSVRLMPEGRGLRPLRNGGQLENGLCQILHQPAMNFWLVWGDLERLFQEGFSPFIRPSLVKIPPRLGRLRLLSVPRYESGPAPRLQVRIDLRRHKKVAIVFNRKTEVESWRANPSWHTVTAS